MKTLDEFVKAALEDKSLLDKCAEAVKKGEVDAFLKANDVDATLEDVKEYVKEVSEKSNCGPEVKQTAKAFAISLVSLLTVCIISAAKDDPKCVED